MEMDRERIEYLIDKRRNKITDLEESAKEQFKELDGDSDESVRQASNIRYSLGNSYLGLVERLLQTPDPDTIEIREAFGKSADNFIESIRIVRTSKPDVQDNQGLWSELPYNGWRALYSTLLSKDSHRQDLAAEETFAIPEEYVEVYAKKAPKYYYAKALAATVMDDDRAADFLTLTRDTAADHPTLEDVEEPGLLDALEAIHEDDEAAVNDGIETHIEHFRDDQEAHNLEPDMYPDFRGAAMTILARERGLDVPARDPNVPEIII